jgi:glycosyltransferase involved in cell wall biosynthesis
VEPRPLRVGVIAPPWLPVPPQGYGGTEAVIDTLVRGLQQAGCEVVLFATGDSTCDVPRRWYYPAALGTGADPGLEAVHARAAHAALRDCDVIHDHTVAGPLDVLSRPGGPPVLATLHGDPSPADLVRYRRVAGSIGLIAISHCQRRSLTEMPVAAVIHHGIDLDAFPLGRGDGGYVAFLGRMSPDKGADRAIRVARAAGRPIVLAAKMRAPEEHRWFAEAVEPLLGPDATFVGEVDAEGRRALLGRAEALVNPLGWPEPFGLVMVEAAASGTPVLAFAAGASPEIVEDGITGFICSDEDDMADRLQLVAGLDRATCRERARARFGGDRMAADHLTLYRRAVVAAALDPHREEPGLTPTGHG